VRLHSSDFCHDAHCACAFKFCATVERAEYIKAGKLNSKEEFSKPQLVDREEYTFCFCTDDN